MQIVTAPPPPTGTRTSKKMLVSAASFVKRILSENNFLGDVWQLPVSQNAPTSRRNSKHGPILQSVSRETEFQHHVHYVTLRKRPRWTASQCLSIQPWRHASALQQNFISEPEKSSKDVSYFVNRRLDVFYSRKTRAWRSHRAVRKTTPFGVIHKTHLCAFKASLFTLYLGNITANVKFSRYRPEQALGDPEG
jgi:hypothetical protein